MTSKEDKSLCFSTSCWGVLHLHFFLLCYWYSKQDQIKRTQTKYSVNYEGKIYTNTHTCVFINEFYIDTCMLLTYPIIYTILQCKVHTTTATNVREFTCSIKSWTRTGGCGVVWCLLVEGKSVPIEWEREKKKFTYFHTLTKL